MSRKLTHEEHALWERLGKTVRPLAKALAKPIEPPAQPAPPKKSPARPIPVHRAPLPPPQKPPALAPLEERTRRRLARRLAEVDARIDLHGMRQERAFTLLQTFLRQEQVRGHRIVLVVTGKGSAGGGEGRGVLRQSVPAWLSRPDLRHLVVGFEPANRRHGGEGALYVRIRRRKEARRAAEPEA
ncbi:MAG: Smr/MutS family protein [Propylenella sp.]